MSITVCKRSGRLVATVVFAALSTPFVAGAALLSDVAESFAALDVATDAEAPKNGENGDRSVAESDSNDAEDAKFVDSASELTRFEFDAEKMGVPSRIVLYANDLATAESAANAAWARIDELNEILSDYDPESEIIQVCRKSEETGDFVPLSADLRNALEASRRYCVATDGAFDATVGPIVKLWRRSRYFKELPPASVLEPAKKTVGLGVWELDERGVKTNVEGVRFDVGGIGKGIALDEAYKTLQTFGIESALVDMGGDLRIGAAPPGKAGWIVGVASLSKDSKPACYRELASVGVASSGDANRFVEIDGVRYSHIVDPRTGEPTTRRCVSTIVAPTATDADAIASAACVLGGETALATIEKLRTGTSAATDLPPLAPLEATLSRVEDGADPPYSSDEIETLSTDGF